MDLRSRRRTLLNCSLSFYITLTPLYLSIFLSHSLNLYVFKPSDIILRRIIIDTCSLIYILWANIHLSLVIFWWLKSYFYAVLDCNEGQLALSIWLINLWIRLIICLLLVLRLWIRFLLLPILIGQSS